MTTPIIKATHAQAKHVDAVNQPDRGELKMKTYEEVTAEVTYIDEVQEWS